MSKRTTKEEKLKIILDKFHETKQYYLLAEFSKDLPKTIAANAKELLQELVSDNLVCSDKIGTSTYFWSFPSQTYATKTASLAQLQAEVEALEAKTQEMENEKLQCEKEMAEVNEEERKEALQRQQELGTDHSRLKAELEKFKDFDPNKIKNTETATVAFREAANRWTDNIFTLESFCVKKFGTDKSDLRKAFGVPSDFDNL